MDKDKEKEKVLFLCTGNSCRSQMAEGWLRHLAGDRFQVFSAGTRPAGLNPTGVAVMKEVGIDISAHYSKHGSECLGQGFAYIITVCDSARESCPVFPGPAQKIHWSFDDPASAPGLHADDERLAIFRRVRDEIGARVKQFIAPTLLAPP